MKSTFSCLLLSFVSAWVIAQRADYRIIPLPKSVQIADQLTGEEQTCILGVTNCRLVE